MSEFDRIDKFLNCVGGMLRLSFIVHETAKQKAWHKCHSSNAEFRSKGWQKHIDEADHFGCEQVNMERALELDLQELKGRTA